MRIVFNAYNLIIAGGLTVGKGITGALLNMELQDEIHVFLPARKEYQFTSNRNVIIHYIPKFFIEYALPRLVINYYLKRKIRGLKPDRVFSLGNYAIPVSCPQLLLLQWPYAVYPEKMIWSRMTWKNYLKRRFRLFLFRKKLKHASAITVQTEIMKSRVQKHLTGYKGEIYVVESSGIALPILKDVAIARQKGKENEKVLLCMSEYYPHKNLEVLIPLAEMIREQKLNYRIIITVDVHKREAAKFLRDIETKSLSGIITNLGKISHERAALIYHHCDALLLPTLLESYGIPYLEAAYAKLPVFTSDLDFAHAVNENNAWYFNPFSPSSILETIKEAFSNTALLEEKTAAAYEKAKQIRSWKEIALQYLTILKGLPE